MMYPMPMPRRRSHNHHHRPYRDRSRLALLLTRQQRKALWIFLGGCLVYSYAFFYWQPDRSFETVKRLNDELKLRETLRQEQRKAKRNGEDLDVVPEVVGGDGPEWQRKMRASAGEMAWKREQEQLAAAGHSNLRGSSEGTRRKHNGSDGLMNLIVMLSFCLLMRTVARACVVYRQVNRIMQAQGGIPPPPPVPIPTTTTTRSNNNNNNTNGRGALARLMVPQSIHYAALLRNARFRTWVNQLNEQREQNGQPPLSMDTLRVMMRDQDFSGNDYEALMQFHEEATLAQSLGATQAEIDRFPHRTLTDPRDELLTTPDHHHVHVPSERHHAQECPICLEKYKLGDRVTRLPCLHEYHVDCVDPWLVQQAVCPVCKHPVVG